jgi:hypothetical protein
LPMVTGWPMLCLMRRSSRRRGSVFIYLPVSLSFFF